MRCSRNNFISGVCGCGSGHDHPHDNIWSINDCWSEEIKMIDNIINSIINNMSQKTIKKTIEATETKELYCAICYHLLKDDKVRERFEKMGYPYCLWKDDECPYGLRTHK